MSSAPEEKNRELDRLARWREDLDRIAEELAAADEQVLADHVDSIIDELDFKEHQLLGTGAVVLQFPTGGRR